MFNGQIGMVLFNNKTVFAEFEHHFPSLPPVFLSFFPIDKACPCIQKQLFTFGSAMLTTSLAHILRLYGVKEVTQ